MCSVAVVNDAKTFPLTFISDSEALTEVSKCAIRLQAVIM